MQLQTSYLEKLLLFFWLFIFLVPVCGLRAQKGLNRLPGKYVQLSFGDVASLQQMLQEGISVNATDEKGNSPLMLAAYRGDLVQMKFLIAAGANVNQRNPQGMFLSFPLDGAIRGNHKQAVDLLLASGADINVKDRMEFSPIYRCGLYRNCEMLRYLIEKGAVVNREDKINILILAAPESYPVSDEAREIIYYILQDIRVEEEDLLKSRLMISKRTEGVKNICNVILSMQKSREERERKKQAQEDEQDSLRELLKTGRADTIRYRYEERFLYHSNGENMYQIDVYPRIEFVSNQVGEKSSTISWILLFVTMILVYFLTQVMVKTLYKERPDYLFPYLAIYVGAGLWVYFLLSSLYFHLDDIRVRKYGEEKTAVLDNDSIRYAYRFNHLSEVNFPASETCFIFTGDDDIQLCVNQGNTRFDRERYPFGRELNTLKVRYDSVTHKLSVDEDTYLMQNLNAILGVLLLFILLLLFSYGYLNPLWRKIGQAMGKRIEKSRRPVLLDEESEPLPNYRTYAEEFCFVSTYWEFSSTVYSSMDEFISSVRQMEEQMYVVDAKNRLQPHEALPGLTSAVITIDDDEIIGTNDVNITLTADNGTCMTQGELLFKLHHRMIPYVDRLVDRGTWGVMVLGNWDGDAAVECMIVFDSKDDEEDDFEDDSRDE